MKKDLLFVDGYNMIGAWPHLAKLQRRDELAAARDLLLTELSEYAKYESIEVRVVLTHNSYQASKKNINNII